MAPKPAFAPKAVAPKAVAPKGVAPKAVAPKGVAPKAVTPKTVAAKAVKSVRAPKSVEAAEPTGSYTKDRIISDVLTNLNYNLNPPQWTKVAVEGAYDEIMNCISNAISCMGTVRVTGLGVFSTKRTAARMGRNPRTGESIPVESGVRVSFRASKDLKTKANENTPA